MLSKCRFDDDIDFQFVQCSAVALVLYVSFQKLIKAASQFQPEQPINGSLWDIALEF